MQENDNRENVDEVLVEITTVKEAESVVVGLKIYGH